MMTNRTRLLAAALLVTCVSTPCAAQNSDENWEVYVAPYLMGASMSGDVTVRGIDVTVDASASDIFSNLQFGAMGLITAKKGNWGFGADALWMALGTTVAETNVDMNQGAFAFYGIRRLGPAADLTFGARVNTLQGTLTFKQTGGDRSQDRTWVDPVVGVTLRSDADRRVQFRVYGEVGGFGAGSTIAWQLFPVVGVRFAKRASIEAGYRWLDTDYSSGDGLDRFRYNVLTQGPIAGLGLRF